MTKDLEQTLAELGAGYPEFVSRMKGAFPDSASGAHPSRRRVAPLLAAAAAMLVFGFGPLMFATCSSACLLPSPDLRRRADGANGSAFMLARSRSDEAIGEILRTQNADGSWQTDFLTRQNADALRGRDDPAAKVAYRKAMRNLRLRGVL